VVNQESGDGWERATAQRLDAPDGEGRAGSAIGNRRGLIQIKVPIALTPYRKMFDDNLD